jgi:hypothetical protein
MLIYIVIEGADRRYGKHKDVCRMDVCFDFVVAFLDSRLASYLAFIRKCLTTFLLLSEPHLLRPLYNTLILLITRVYLIRIESPKEKSSTAFVNKISLSDSSSFDQLR